MPLGQAAPPGKGMLVMHPRRRSRAQDAALAPCHCAGDASLGMLRRKADQLGKGAPSGVRGRAKKKTCTWWGKNLASHLLAQQEWIVGEGIWVANKYE